MGNGAAWNPVEEIRQKYPALKGWDDQRILANLQNPAKFRSAFPQYSHLDDQTIIRNMGKMTAAAAPKGFDEQHPILASVENFFSNPIGGQWAQNKLKQAQQMEASEINQAYGPEADIESQKFKQAATRSGVPQPIQQIGDVATRAYHQGKSLAAAAAQIPYGMLSMTVPEAGLTVGSTLAGQPEIAGSYWATRGITNATNSVPAAVQNPTPENVRGGLTDLSMISGGLGAVPERPANAAAPTPFGIGRPAPPPVPTTEAVPRGGLIQRGVRSMMGMGQKVMEKGAKAALDEQAFEHGKVTEQNRQAAAKTNLENQQQAAEDYQARRLVEEQNEALRAKTEQRAALQQQTLDDSAKLAQAAQQKALATRAEGKAKYDVVTKAVGDAGVPSTDIAALVKHAEDNILAGSRPESIRQFRLMLEQGATEPEAVASSVGQITPGSPLYQALVEQGAIQPQQAATVPFRDMQGYVTELGDRMYGSGVPNDVFKALGYVRDGIKSQMQKIANEHGVGPQLTEAQQFWRGYEQVYNNARNVTQARGGLTSERIGSPVAQLVRMQDPEVIRSLVTGKVSDRLVSMLKSADPQLSALAEQIRKNHAESSKPLGAKLKETPQFSEPKPGEPPKHLPESPNLPELTQQARQAELDRRVKALRSPNVQRWEMVGMLTGILGQMFGRHGSEYLTVGSATGLAGSALLARALESPKVIDWLTTPTAHDIAILNKLDPAAKSALQDAITQKMSDKRITPSPVMKSFLTPQQNAAILGAIGAHYSTPQSIMLGMKSGELSPTEGARLLQRLRRSASAGPVRRLSSPATPPVPTP